MENLLTLDGVRGYVDENGIAQLNLEDVARGLGFTRSASSGNEVVRWERVRLYLNELAVPTCGHEGNSGLPDFIPENIFYRLAMKARNAVAETFQAKVADEILPAIRKHGGYLTPDKIEEALLNPDVLINLATQLKYEREERLRLQAETEKQSAIITQQAPKVEYYEQILSSDGTLSVSQIAKDYCISAIELNRILKAEGFQYKVGKQWLPKAKYHSLGFTKSETVTNEGGRACVVTKWTQAGRAHIHRLLTSKGIIAEYGPNEQGKAYLADIRMAENNKRKGRSSNNISELKFVLKQR